MYCSKNSGSFDVATEIAADGQGGPSITPDSENLASSSTTDSTQFSASGTDVEVVTKRKPRHQKMIPKVMMFSREFR